MQERGFINRASVIYKGEIVKKRVVKKMNIIPCTKKLMGLFTVLK